MQDGYTSHLNIHGTLIIGFAVILLTLLEIRVRLQFISSIQFCILYFGIFVATLAFWRLFWRHMIFGCLVDAVMFTEVSETKESLLKEKIEETVLKRRLGILPACWFFSTDRRSVKFQRACGWLTCGGFAIATTLCFWILVG